MCLYRLIAETDARSVGDSHSPCFNSLAIIFIDCLIIYNVWSGGVVVRASHLHREVAGSLHVTTTGKLFTHMCICLPSSINWYRRSWVPNRHSARHIAPCLRTCSFDWCLADGCGNGAQRRPMGPCGSDRTLAFS